jgi:hypothetical protein
MNHDAAAPRVARIWMGHTETVQHFEVCLPSAERVQPEKGR